VGLDGSLSQTITGSKGGIPSAFSLAVTTTLNVLERSRDCG
jgi:hypothetical protein